MGKSPATEGLITAIESGLEPDSFWPHSENRLVKTPSSHEEKFSAIYRPTATRIFHLHVEELSTERQSVTAEAFNTISTTTPGAVKLGK